MEFKTLIISQTDTSNKYIFNNKVNLVSSTVLSDDLLKTNYEKTSNNYVIESLNKISLNELFQIKIRIKDLGIILVNFEKEKISEEDRQKLLGEISSLKSDEEITEETQKSKVAKAIDILTKYSPAYICYTNTGNYLFTKFTFEEMVKDKEIDFPILVCLTSLLFEDKPFDPKKKNSSKAKKSKTPKQRSGGASRSKEDIIGMFKSLEYIFFGVFSMFIAFGFVVSIYELINGEGIAAFLIVLIALFVIVMCIAANKAYKENEYFEYKLNKLWVAFTYIALGLALGMIIGYVVTSFVIPLKEGVEMNYVLVYMVSIIGSIVLSVASIFSPLLFQKFKKKKE